MIDYIDFGHTLAKRRKTKDSCVFDLSDSGYVQLCNLFAKVFSEFGLWDEFDDGVFQEACEVVGENGPYESIVRQAKSVIAAVEVVEVEQRAGLFEIDGVRVKVFPRRITAKWIR